MAEARRRVLAHLADHQVAPISEVPRAFPVTQILLRMAAAQLIARGLIESVPDSETDSRGMLRITGGGRRELEKMGWPLPTAER
jgi:DNA-binding MarR family transcriptional regulator